jgi:predicted HTH domain antitoxin
MIAIKTEKEVGKLIQKSKIDNKDVRLIYASELIKLEVGDFELIYAHDNIDCMNEAQTIILNKLMKQK